MFLFILSAKLNAQEIIMPMNDEKKISYVGVVNIEGKNQQKLYADAKEYIVVNYTAKDFPTILDEANERIYVKGTFRTPLRKYIFPIFFHTTVYDLIYTYKIYFKDNKYRYEITDMVLTRKTNARLKGYYWGGGVSSGSIEEGQVFKTDLEKMYSVRRYRKKWNKLFYTVATEVNKEIERLNSYMKKENDSKKW